MGKRHVYLLAGTLAAAGLALFLVKWLTHGFPLLPGARALAWDIEVKLSFMANGGPVKITTFIPRTAPGVHVFDQRFLAPGYGLSAQSAGDNREVVLATRNAKKGPKTAHVRFVVHRFVDHSKGATDDTPKPAPPSLEGARKAAADDILTTARSRSSDNATLAAAVAKLFSAAKPEDSVKELIGRERNGAARAIAAAEVMNLAGIPARAVHGVDLGADQKEVDFVRWVEAFVQGKWVGYSLATGNPELPKGYMAWWRGRASFVSLSGARKPETRLTVVQLEEQALDQILGGDAKDQARTVRFSLFGLPLATQNVYRVLLVVPLGIFFLVVLRNVIGIRGLGTFMPVLIALAFRETNLIWGIALFTAIVASGLLFRFYLEQLKLLLVPRLASVLIFVVLFMAVASVVTNQLGLERGLSVSLFPMVIMTMTIERVSVLWDERGASHALTQAVGSLIVASACYLIMSHAVVEHLFFTFPELLLILLAATILLGRYSGYRLLELRRFRVLVEEKS